MCCLIGCIASKVAFNVLDEYERGGVEGMFVIQYC